MSNITLEDLKPAEGSTSKIKRVGRGRSSGRGKTSCRGHNGEGQRSGNSAKRGFEGGQMPAYRRLPKLKGFQVYSKVNYAQINVGRLDDLGLKEISLESLREVLTIHPSCVGLRVLCHYTNSTFPPAASIFSLAEGVTYAALTVTADLISPLPKLKGFQVYSKVNYAQINVGRLDDLGLKEISLESLREVLTIHPSCVGLRVLGNGEIKSAVTVKAAYVTPSAKEKIEAAGGKVELV